MTDLFLKRLTPEDPTSWGFWPVFEACVRAALPAFEPDANPDRVIDHYRALWGTQHTRLGAWLIMKPWAWSLAEFHCDHEPGEIVGHIAAYIDAYWGQPCLMIHQIHGMPWEGCLGLRPALLRAWEDWKDEVNARYALTNTPQVSDLVRFYAMQPVAAVRWLREAVDVRAGGTLVSFRLSEVAIPSEVA